MLGKTDNWGPVIGGSIAAIKRAEDIIDYLNQKADRIRSGYDRSCPRGRSSVTGKMFMPGQIGYRFDTLPSTVFKHYVWGSHYNMYILNQRPSSAPQPCRCVWGDTGYALPVTLPGGLPIDVIFRGAVDVNIDKMR